MRQVLFKVHSCLLRLFQGLAKKFVKLLIYHDSYSDESNVLYVFAYVCVWEREKEREILWYIFMIFIFCKYDKLSTYHRWEIHYCDNW